jgi:hypothetical protein
MRDFTVTVDGRKQTFTFGLHFVEGNERDCWTPDGITKLINAGLWRREFDQRGNLKTKPPTVADVMRMAKRQLEKAPRA